MKILILIFIAISANANLNSDYFYKKGYSSSIVCGESGFLTLVYSKVKNGEKLTASELVCYDYSSWNRACLHPPIRCKKETK